MRKKHILLVLTAGMMAVSAYFGSKSVGSIDLLLTANIEALAESEVNVSDGSWLMVYDRDYGGFICCLKNTGWCTSSWLPCSDYY